MFLLLVILSIGRFVVDRAIDSLKTTIAALHIKHKKNTVRTKVKELAKRLVAAIPVVGC
jgi:hypothetical protein